MCAGDQMQGKENENAQCHILGQLATHLTCPLTDDDDGDDVVDEDGNGDDDGNDDDDDDDEMKASKENAPCHMLGLLATHLTRPLD